MPRFPLTDLTELVKDVREADIARLGFAVFLVVTCVGYVMAEVGALTGGAAAAEWAVAGGAAFFALQGVWMVWKTIALGGQARRERLRADGEASEEIRRLARRAGEAPTEDGGAAKSGAAVDLLGLPPKRKERSG